MKQKTAALCLIMIGITFAPTASADHNVCSNEEEDIQVGTLFGIDGPIGTDGNGEQVCVANAIVAVIPDGAPEGIGAGVSVCAVTSGYQACPAGERLGFTGASVLCGTSSVPVCVWVDGNRL